MKAGWEVRRLSEVTTKIGSGATPRGGNVSYKQEGLSLIRSLNVHDLDFRTKDLALIDDTQAEALSNVIVEPRDVLLNITGASIARCTVVPTEVLPARVNQHVSIIRPMPQKVDSNFLAYLLVSQDVKERLLGIGDEGGSTRQALTKAQLQEFPILLPPLEEQQRIVAFLDEAFEGLTRARAHAEANLQNARELFRRYIEVEFCLLAQTQPRRTVGDIAVIKGGKRLPKGDKLVPTKTPFPYISIKDFNDRGSVNVAGIDYLMPETRAAIKNYIIRSEDLYISIAGTIGKTGIVPAELDGANLTENAARMVFKEGINNEYVYYFTLTDDFQDQAGLNTRTAAQPKLALERLKTISLPVVPLARQIEMADRFQTFREQSQIVQLQYLAKLQSIDALRQSLLQKAFAGELT